MYCIILLLKYNYKNYNNNLPFWYCCVKCCTLIIIMIINSITSVLVLKILVVVQI